MTREFLPRGGGLDQQRWYAYHRVLLVILAVQVPILLAVAILQGRSQVVVALILAILATALGIGGYSRSGRVAILAVALGLVVTSAVVVWLTGGAPESRLHVFAVLGFVALYRDWPAYLGAVGGAGVSQVGAGAAATGWTPGDPPGEAALVAALFVLATGLLHLLWWRASDEHGDGPARRAVQGDADQALTARLREAERLKRELVAVVSHEFRTPLASIMGFAQTLEQRMDQIDRRTMLTCLRLIEQQARRLERIVTNLLVASDDVTAQPGQAADLTTVTAAVLQDLEGFPGPGTNHIVADIEPGLRVRMSPLAASRILINLLDNALKFAAPHTEIRLRGRREADDVVLEVTDRGTSISEHDLDRIFDPFVQADSSDTRRAEGIGLGLAIVRRLAEAHGGQVEARNEPPWVVLVVSLPLAEAASDTVPISRDPVGART